MYLRILLSIAVGLTASFLNGCSDLVDKAPPSGISQQAAPGPSQLSTNSPPSISGNPNSDALIGQAWTFAPSATDPDGDPLTFAIENQPVWASFDRTTGHLSGVPQIGQQGRYAGISISAHDGETSTALPSFSVTVLSTSTNSAPVISGSPPGVVATSSPYLFQPDAYDADGDLLVFRISGLPPWAEFDTANGRVAGTPEEADAGMYTGVIVSVNDGRQSAALPEFSIEVLSPTTPNNAPVISGTAPTIGQPGETYKFEPVASDADGDTLTYTIANQPGWASFNASSGTLTGTPNSGDTGIYQGILISVSDGQSTSALPEFAITIQEAIVPNRAPQISGSPVTSASVGQLYLFQPSATDPDGDNLTFSVANRPAWVAINAITGMLTGTPGASDEGSHRNIVVSVSDGEFSTALPAFTITVDNPDANEAPEISGNPPLTVTVGDFYSFQPTATDPEGDDLTFSIANRPAWVSFSSITGMLSGTPAASAEGRHQNIVVSVSDGEFSTALPAFTITVDNPDANEAPEISGNPPLTVTVGDFYSFQPTATDPEGDDLTFSIVNRPAWVSFSSITGMLSGTPAASDEGSHQNIVVSVSDGEFSTALPAFTIRVDNPNANEAPEISGNPPLTVTVGDFYSFQPIASDADGDDLTFSIANRPLWSGFDSASGRLSGLVAENDEGIYGNIIVTVSDGSLSASLGSFEISVVADESNEPPTISGNPNTSATVDQFYSFLPDASDPDGDSLSFSISNQPEWTVFDTNTGLLSGTPLQGDATTYNDIRISVSDGDLSAGLAEFSIDVAQVATGSATLSWTAPTLNTDGSTLTDLAAYKIYYGTSRGDYSSEERIDNPGLTTYVIENLSPGTYYFVVSSINDQEIESDPSNEASNTIN